MINIFYIYGPNLSKNYLVRFFLFLAQNVFSLAVQLYRVRENVSTFSVLVCYNTNSFFLRSFSFMHWSVQFIRSKFFYISVFVSLLWGFIVSCSSLILLLPNIASLDGLFRYGSSISNYVQFLVSFLVNIFSTALALPALIVLRTLVNLFQ